MADQFDVCVVDFKAQLISELSNPYFPAAEGLVAGWQVSEDDTTPFQGGDYFIILRAGAFSKERKQDFEMNEWHIQTVLYFRYAEYSQAWALYRTFRNAVISLPDTAKLRTHGIYDQTFSASEDAGYLVNSQGQYTNFIVQKLDCTIYQKVHRNRVSLGQE